MKRVRLYLTIASMIVLVGCESLQSGKVEELGEKRTASNRIAVETSQAVICKHMTMEVYHEKFGDDPEAYKKLCHRAGPSCGYKESTDE